MAGFSSSVPGNPTGKETKVGGFLQPGARDVYLSSNQIAGRSPPLSDRILRASSGAATGDEIDDGVAALLDCLAFGQCLLPTFPINQASSLELAFQR